MVTFFHACDCFAFFFASFFAFFFAFLLNIFKQLLTKEAPVIPSIKNPIPSDKTPAINQNICVTIVNCTIVIDRYPIGFLQSNGNLEIQAETKNHCTKLKFSVKWIASTS